MMQPWVCFSSSSGETFEALYAQISNELKDSLVGFYLDRECGAADVARKLLNTDRVFLYSRADFESQVLKSLHDTAGLGEISVFLCGFFGILSDHFLNQCPGPVINTHPSILPAFPGLNNRVHKAASDTVSLSGFTLHLVTRELDGGPILFQHPVWLDPRADWESHRARVRQAEQKYLPFALSRILKASLTRSDYQLSSSELRRKCNLLTKTFTDMEPT